MDINVFELAFKENAALASTPAKPDKKVMESVTRGIKNAELKKESIQLGKIRFTEDAEELSTVQPEEDVVVVYSDDIKPDMTEEEVAQAAEDLIGATICKCGVCGANYISNEEHAHDDEIVVEEPAAEEAEVADAFTFTDDEEDALDGIEFADEGLGESLLFREDVEDETDADAVEADVPVHTCPVCDATESQVEVGEIVPTEDAAAEEATEEESTEGEETSEDPVEDETSVDDEVVEASEGDDDDEDDEAPVKVDVDVNVAAEDDDTKKESVESRDTNVRAKHPVKAADTKLSDKRDEVSSNERAFTSLLNKFVNENYGNIKSIEITAGRATKKGQLQFEGIVTTKSGKTRSVTFETVGFKYTEGPMKIKMIEKGPFTESARIQKNAVPFVLECHCRAGRIMPTALKYRYAVKVKNEWFECSGKHSLSENRKSVRTEKKNNNK